MADLWYYTRNGEQQEPVSTAELKGLAASGGLKPNDLVWKEGMAEWKPASNVTGLMSSASADEESASARTRPSETRVARDADPEQPRRRRVAGDEDGAADSEDRPRRRRRVVEDEDEDDYEERPRRRRREEADDDEDDDDRAFRRRRRRSRQGMGAGAKFAIIAGSIALVLVIAIGLLVLILSGDSGGEGSRSFSLADGQVTSFNVRFTGGKKVEVWVQSTGPSDVDLYVFDAAGREIRFDDGDSNNCYLWFLTDSTQTYRLEVRNMHRVDQLARNGHNSGTLTFKESDGKGVAPPPPQVHQGRVVPPGPGFRRRR